MKPTPILRLTGTDGGNDPVNLSAKKNKSSGRAKSIQKERAEIADLQKRISEMLRKQNKNQKRETLAPRTPASWEAFEFAKANAILKKNGWKPGKLSTRRKNRKAPEILTDTRRTGARALRRNTADAFASLLDPSMFDHGEHFAQ